MNSSTTTAPPSPPPNTPNCSRLEDELKDECQRQENQLKEHLRSKNVLQIFSDSDYVPLNEAKRRKRRPASIPPLFTSPKIDPYMNGQSVSLNLRTNSNHYSHCGFQVSAKETSRRRRTSVSIQRLCKIVPGVNDKTDDTKALELAAKYILFLKTKVNPDHDKEFLRKQII